LGRAKSRAVLMASFKAWNPVVAASLQTKPSFF